MRKLFSRRFLAGALTLPLVITGVGVLTPGVAEAAVCGQSWTDPDPGGGEGIQNPSYVIPVHTGIYGDCDITHYISTGIRLQYHCYRRNSYGNTWTHLNMKDYPNVRGWVWDDYLNNNGSNYPC